MTRPAGTGPLRASDPARIGGYRLAARLGAGGMADVFYSVAYTGRPVAIKVLRPAGGVAAACHREYQLARAAGADCTAPALGYSISSAGSYLVTAYLPGYRCGTTLTGALAPAKWLWRFGAALARALTVLPARGIVHCDVPSNLLVRGHDVRLIDFGISRYVDEPSWGDQAIQCSPGWAAPEQLCAGVPHARGGRLRSARRGRTTAVGSGLGLLRSPQPCAAPGYRDQTEHRRPGVPRPQPPLAVRAPEGPQS
jgi:hypothetical protein